MKKIIQQEHPTLRKTAEPVLVSDISSLKIQSSIANMFESLKTQKDGIALAAPQINISKRIFVISPQVNENGLDIPLVYINPVLISQSKDKKTMEEGCLSCRWWYGKTKRTSRATVEAYNEHGKKFKHEGTGLIAQIFQHEIDHLNGILFIDHAKNLKEVSPDEE